MEDSNPTMTPREHWQRAVSKVAAERIVDDGIQDGSAFARVVKQRTFIKMVNSERAFQAAFGARSLRNSLSLSSKQLDDKRKKRVQGLLGEVSDAAADGRARHTITVLARP